MSPTITTPRDDAGGVDPRDGGVHESEQARGKTVDKRSDIWAFGCVFYEMLTRRRAFQGEGVSDTLANILTQEPTGTRCRPTPDTDSAHCCDGVWRRIAAWLDLRHRRAVGDRRSTGGFFCRDARACGGADRLARAGLARAIPWTIAAVLAVVVLGLGIQFRTLEPQRAAQPVAQLEMSLPAGVEVYQGASQVVAFTPAGTHVAFVGSLNGAETGLRARPEPARRGRGPRQ